MKRLARIVGVIGGVAAILWAMKDRLVSIAAPREPEPPRFRVVAPTELPPSLSGGDDLTEVSGIGPVFAARLRQSGIATFAGLAAADPDHVAGIAGTSPSRVTEWIAQAARLAD